MSEILIYKANECTSKLDEATEIVNAEIHRLDHNADSAFEKVNARFQAALDAIGKWIDSYYLELKFFINIPLLIRLPHNRELKEQRVSNNQRFTFRGQL